MIDNLTANRGQGMLLLTGASGLVGSGLIPILQAFDPNRIIAALVRQPDALANIPGLVTFRANLGVDGLGLDNCACQLLRNRVTEIIHCAADVRFNVTIESSREVNLEGTRRLLAFAELCPNLSKFAHVSTLYIAGKRSGAVREESLRHDCGYFNVYEQSKHEAEQLVLDHMDRLPVSIYRLSAIIGNSVTGEIARKNFFHALIALVPHISALPCLPIDPTAPVDLIADDWCCEALVFLFQKHFRAGSIHHLCAGQEMSLNAWELINVVVDLLEEQTGRRVMIPPLGAWSEVEQHRVSCSSANEGALLDLMSKFMPHLGLSQPFDRGLTGQILGQHEMTPPLARSFVRRVISQTSLHADSGVRGSARSSGLQTHADGPGRDS